MFEQSAKKLSPKLPGDCSASCGQAKWVGDGYCDDNNNNCGCNWDGGDCCGPFSGDDYCDSCDCKDPDSEYYGTVCNSQCASSVKQGDGYCDDDNNVCGCDWDGGDCCLSDLNTDDCTECECLDPDAADTSKGGGSSKS